MFTIAKFPMSGRTIPLIQADTGMSFILSLRASSLERAGLLQRVGALGVARDRVQPVFHLAIGLGDDLGAHRRRNATRGV